MKQPNDERTFAGWRVSNIVRVFGSAILGAVVVGAVLAAADAPVEAVIVVFPVAFAPSYYLEVRAAKDYEEYHRRTSAVRRLLPILGGTLAGIVVGGGGGYLLSQSVETTFIPVYGGVGFVFSVFVGYQVGSSATVALVQRLPLSRPVEESSSVE